MELKFLGSGSAFNTKLGNTSAFFFDKGELFLIDCGSTVFSKIQEYRLLDNVKVINIFITHLHADHVGSLATLIQYCNYMYRRKITVKLVFPVENDEKNDIINQQFSKELRDFLAMQGVDKRQYQSVSVSTFDNQYDTFDEVRYYYTTHVGDLICYGLIFHNEDNVNTIYTGDSHDMIPITRALELEHEGKLIIDKIYTDISTTSFAHLNLYKLDKAIDYTDRHKIYCMHFDSSFDKDTAAGKGFQVVENYKGE